MKYRPASGTEGMDFQERFCCHCKKEDFKTVHCDILSRSMMYGIDEKEYPEEWIWNKTKPICTAFEEVK